MEKKNILKKIKRIASNIFLLFTIAILGYCIYLVVQSNKTGEEVYIFGYKPYIIQTGSMEPTLKINSLIIVKKGEFEKVQDYDIISFKLQEFDRNVCHRVISIENEELTTKGDNNNNPDDVKVTKENYVGRVVFSTNITSHIISIFDNPGTAIIIVASVIAIIIILIAVRVLIKNRYKGKRMKEKNEN